MRSSDPNPEDAIQQELLLLYRRIETNAKTFGMSPKEVEQIKRECALAYRHKIVLDKIHKRQAKDSRGGLPL